MPEHLTPATIPSREKIGWREWAALILAIGIGLGIWRVDTTATAAGQAADRATATSTANREIGYRNRAAICDFIREFGGIEPRQCGAADIAPYRDPRIAPGEGERANTTRLLCRILAALKTPAAQCAGGP